MLVEESYHKQGPILTRNFDTLQIPCLAPRPDYYSTYIPLIVMLLFVEKLAYPFPHYMKKNTLAPSTFFESLKVLIVIVVLYCLIVLFVSVMNYKVHVLGIAMKLMMV